MGRSSDESGGSQQAAAPDTTAQQQSEQFQGMMQAQAMARAAQQQRAMMRQNVMGGAMQFGQQQAPDFMGLLAQLTRDPKKLKEAQGLLAQHPQLSAGMTQLGYQPISTEQPQQQDSGYYGS